jgi:superfamily II DNA helicase RecQ
MITVARFVTEIKAERVVCLTATATQNVGQDICRAFEIDKSGLFRTTMYRPKYIFLQYLVSLELDNLTLVSLRLLARATYSKQENYPHLFSFLREHPGATIIYVTVQKV